LFSSHVELYLISRKPEVLSQGYAIPQKEPHEIDVTGTISDDPSRQGVVAMIFRGGLRGCSAVMPYLPTGWRLMLTIPRKNLRAFLALLIHFRYGVCSNRLRQSTFDASQQMKWGDWQLHPTIPNCDGDNGDHVFVWAT
jgi:hypothetical protein